MSIHLVIHGKAVPAGSKSANAIYRRNDWGEREPVTDLHGRVRVAIRDANKNASAWKDAVAWQARAQYHGPVLTGPCCVEMIFHEPRPKSHYGSGRNAELVRDSAPAYPAKKPDVLKLARAVEDALTGVIYADDSLTVDLIARKRYVGRDEDARVEVNIEESVTQTVGDLVVRGITEPPRPADFDQLVLV